MINGLLRLIGLGVLVIIAIGAMFLVIHIAVRLVIFGAIAVGILWLISSFKKKGGSTDPICQYAEFVLEDNHSNNHIGVDTSCVLRIYFNKPLNAGITGISIRGSDFTDDKTERHTPSMHAVGVVPYNTVGAHIVRPPQNKHRLYIHLLPINKNA